LVGNSAGLHRRTANLLHTPNASSHVSRNDRPRASC
jgi:hypothetical protein